MKTKLLKRVKKLRSIMDVTTFGEKLYILGFMLILWGGVLWIFTEKYSTFTLLFGYIIFTCGLISEAIKIINRMWENKYSKIIITLITAAGSTIVLAASTLLVSDIVGTDPSKFPYTISLVTFMLLPIITCLLLLAVAIISFFISITAMPFTLVHRQILTSPVFRYIFRVKQKPRKEVYFWLMILVRSVAIGFLFGAVQIGERYYSDYTNYVKTKASAFIFNFELYKQTHCTRLNDSERFGYINAKLVIIGTPEANDNYSFKTRLCKIEKI